MRSRLIIILMLLSNILNAFDVVPNNFKPKNIEVTFETPDAINGAIGNFTQYEIDKNSISSQKIIEYYSKYFNNEWEICENKVTKYNKWFTDYKQNKFELKEIRIMMNKKRNLSIGIKIADNIKTKTLNVFVIQYHYNNKIQLNQEYNALCR